MAEPVVILEPGDERAQKVAKAMASQTAGDILRFIGTGEKTITEIAETLMLPMNTVKYHTENLLDAGLISVASTKYSVKGREVKVYHLTSQLLIVAPRQANIRSLLLKYASLFCIIIFGSLGIALTAPLITQPAAESFGDMGAGPGAGYAAAKAVSEGVAQNVTAAVPAALNTGANLSPERLLAASPSPLPAEVMVPASHGMVLPGFSLLQDPPVVFFLGGVFILIILAAFELYQIRRMSADKKR